VAPRALADDTAAEVEGRQIAAWRRMSPAEKADIITSLTGAAFEMAMAGVRARHPGAGPREHFLRLAVVVLGRDLAERAYPEIAAIERR
jgi:hypothetical protein